MLRKFALLFLIAMGSSAYGQSSEQPIIVHNEGKIKDHELTVNCISGCAPSLTWHLLTKSRGGTISLIKNLTEHECQFARARVLGLPATDEEEEKAKRRREIEFPKCVELYQSESGSTPRNSKIWEEWKRANPAAKGCTGPEGTTTIWSSTTHVVNDGDIETAECFK
jgi:hypothetical protein